MSFKVKASLWISHKKGAPAVRERCAGIAGEVPGDLQSPAKVPLSKAPNPQMLMVPFKGFFLAV